MRTLRQPQDTYPSFPKAIPNPLLTHPAENEATLPSGALEGGLHSISCMSFGGGNDDADSLCSGVDWGHKHNWVSAGDGKGIRLAVGSRSKG
jgi:hypothetical protein